MKKKTNYGFITIYLHIVKLTSLQQFNLTDAAAFTNTYYRPVIRNRFRSDDPQSSIYSSDKNNKLVLTHCLYLYIFIKTKMVIQKCINWHTF